MKWFKGSEYTKVKKIIYKKSKVFFENYFCLVQEHAYLSS